MYLFFYMALGLNDFDAGKSITRLFWPKWHWLRSLPFQGHKKSRFSGPPLPMALVMDLARIRIITSHAYKQQVH
jgi:hypothetical protein